MEKKKVFRVLALFSNQASLMFDVFDLPATNVEEFIAEHAPDLKQDYDWSIVEFETKAEAKAYVQGVNDANGWGDPNAILL